MKKDRTIHLMLLNRWKRRLLNYHPLWSTRTWKGDRSIITDPKKSGMFLQMLTVVVLMLFALCVGCGDTTTYYKDSDGDGYGDPDTAREAFAQPSGYVTKGEDCNDSDAAINPGATELCDDGIDNDCDGYSDTDDSDCPVPLLRSGLFTHALLMRKKQGSPGVSTLKPLTVNWTELTRLMWT